MERIYRFSAPLSEVERTSSPPPAAPRALAPVGYWDFDEPDFQRIPELRQWFVAERIGGVSEEGFVRATGRLESDERLVLLTGSKVTRAAVEDQSFFSAEACRVCGLVTRRIVAEPHVSLAGAPPAGSTLSYVPALDTFLAPSSVVEDLETSGLSRGLATASALTREGDYVALYSKAFVGEPTAPYGTTGETCANCGRSCRQTDDGVIYPGLPKYSFFLIFERPGDDAQWVWSTIDGQTRPMVTPDVAAWLQSRDASINVITRGWMPEDLDRAFLPKELR